MSEEIKKVDSSKKVIVVLLIAIVGLIGGIAYMSKLYSDKIQELNKVLGDNTKLKSDLSEVNKSIGSVIDIEGRSNDLKTNLTNMLSNYDELIKMDKSKSDSLNLEKSKIQGLLNQINTLKNQGNLTYSKLLKMEKENETLREIMKSYIKEIDQLNQLNKKIQTDLDQTSEKLTSTETERDEYKKVAEETSEKVKQGSKLQAYSFTSSGMELKRNNTTKETTKAKETIQIKCLFTVGSNSLASAGKKTVYMQVITPEGKTLQSRSGNVVTIDGTSIPFSEKRDIDYENNSIDVGIYYDMRGEKATKGTYKVKIYCEGNLIGSDSFTLK
jgi:DNA repair ATPase RecN